MTDVVRFGLGRDPGVLVLLEDVEALERDGFLCGNAYVAPTGEWIERPDGLEPIYRRVDPTTLTPTR